MVTTCYETELFADYHQFYLQDENAELDDSGDLWGGTSVQDLLFVQPGIISVGTARDMTVPVTVEIHDSEPDEKFDPWDHVTECSIQIPTGKLVVAGCTDYFPEAKRIDVDPGNYRARIFYANLDTLSWNGLDGEDKYKIVFWKGDARDPIVLKRRTSSSN